MISLNDTTESLNYQIFIFENTMMLHIKEPLLKIIFDNGIGLKLSLIYQHVFRRYKRI